VCGRISGTDKRCRCDSCCRTACDGCVDRLLGAERLKQIREGSLPWLCFCCDAEQLEYRKPDLGSGFAKGFGEGQPRREQERGDQIGTVAAQMKGRKPELGFENGKREGETRQGQENDLQEVVKKGKNGDTIDGALQESLSEGQSSGKRSKSSALGKRRNEGDHGHGQGLGEVAEIWGFCQCNSCADRYTGGKKDSQSPASK
jgi:hypothetical protein